MDINELMAYLITPIAQVALIVGLAEIVKRIGCPTRWIPAVDILLGLISGIGVYHVIMDFSIPESILVGIALGLSACGLFSGIKNTIADEMKGDEEDGN